MNFLKSVLIAAGIVSVVAWIAGTLLLIHVVFGDAGDYTVLGAFVFTVLCLMVHGIRTADEEGI